MNFTAFKSRFDDGVLQDLLGASALRLISLIDPELATRSNLLDLVIDLYTPEGLLLSKRKREILLDLLTMDEAERLAVILRAARSPDVYSSLKRLNIARGSTREQELFDFFALVPPPVDEVEQTLATELVEAGYPLFAYQRDAARKIQYYLSSNERRVILHMPTGSGKTRTAMNIIAEHLRANEPTLVIWLAHSQELCEQAALEFNKAWQFLGNREISINRYWEDREIDVSQISDGLLVAGLAKTFQAAKRDVRFITELGRRCSLVVIDEAHAAIADTYQLILDMLVVQRRTTGLLGLTATPGRTWLDMSADEQLSQFFNYQKVSLEVEGYENPVDFLVQEKYLAQTQFRSLFYDSGPELSSADIASIERSMDIPPEILSKLADDEQRNLHIVAETQRLAGEHKRIIVFAATVEHANLIAAVLRARGFDSKSVTSATPSVERAISIDRFKQRTDDVRILCNYGVLTTGFDAPQTSAAIIARPTKSLVLYSQMVGRAIRGELAGGNATAEIVTVVDQQLPGFRSVADAFHHWEDIWR